MLRGQRLVSIQETHVRKRGLPQIFQFPPFENREGWGTRNLISEARGEVLRCAAQTVDAAAPILGEALLLSDVVPARSREARCLPSEQADSSADWCVKRSPADRNLADAAHCESRWIRSSTRFLDEAY